LEENSFIKGCQNAEANAQRQLYESYLPYVLTIARRFGIADQEMADVIQEIFIEILSNIDKYDSNIGEFKYWLKSVAIHKILNIQRKQGRKREITVEYLEETLAVKHTNTANLDNEFLIQLIRELPDGYRRVFNLFVVDGFSHQEIGEKLGIDAGSSRSQLSRAKQLLRQKLLAIQKGNKYGLI